MAGFLYGSIVIVIEGRIAVRLCVTVRIGPVAEMIPFYSFAGQYVFSSAGHALAPVVTVGIHLTAVAAVDGGGGTGAVVGVSLIAAVGAAAATVFPGLTGGFLGFFFSVPPLKPQMIKALPKTIKNQFP